MCIVSNAYDSFAPVIPWPKPDPVPPKCNAPGICFCPMCWSTRAWPWGPVPNTGQELSPKALKQLLDAFHKAVEAARAADRAAGQADCEDPEKAKVEQRVAELERRLADLEAAKPRAKSRKQARK